MKQSCEQFGHSFEKLESEGVCACRECGERISIREAEELAERDAWEKNKAMESIFVNSERERSDAEETE
jgi:predicted  nucleic acid-binding Zn-ribbon protein